MEIKNLKKKLPIFIEKYKFVGLIILIGVVLMLLPTGSKKSAAQNKTIIVDTQQILVEEELTAILKEIKGVGNVKILLTKGEGEETIYQTDSDTSNSDSGRSNRSSTVTVTDAERSQTGLVRQVNPPTYLGAVVVCQGAGNPEVRLAVIDAVSKATGLKVNCISVLEMK